MKLIRTVSRALSSPLATLLLGLQPGAGAAQESADFHPLIPEHSRADWRLVEAEADSFSWRDGILTITQDRGWLQSPRQYADFVLRLEVHFQSENADSGVFVRAGGNTPFIRGWPGNSYQVQLRDISANPSDRPLPLGHIYRLQVPEGETSYRRERVFDLYRGVGEWHEMEIAVLGGRIEVRLEGELVTVAEDIANARGYIGFQSETGSLQLRDIRIREL